MPSVPDIPDTWLAALALTASVIFGVNYLLLKILQRRRTLSSVRVRK